MKKRIIALTALLMALVMTVGFVGCKKESTTTFDLSTLVSDTINLNTATPPKDVSPTPTIVATFTVAVNAATATDTNITMIRTYDQAKMTLNITVNGGVITIVPTDNLGNGTEYTLYFKGLMSTDNQSLADFNRSFQTVGNFVPGDMVAYWNFEGNGNDQAGNYNANAEVDIAYQPSYSTAAGQAAYFNGTTSIMEIPNAESLSNTMQFTISFWVKTVSEGHVDANGNPKGHFVMGLGAFYGFQFEIAGDYGSCKLAATYNINDTAQTSQDLWFNGSGEYNQNGGWKGWTFCKDLTGSGGVAALIKDTWANVVCVYDGTTKIGIMYINGQEMKAQDFNLYDPPVTMATNLKYGGNTPDVYPTLAFGFIQSREGTMWATEPWGGYQYPTANHFGGWLDDVRIWHKALTAQEVSLMYVAPSKK